MILIVDFGSQTTHLISRRLRNLGIKSEITSPDQAILSLKKETPKGIVLSGGPSSVYSEGAPSIETSIFEKGIPILGICYGMQLFSHLLGGKVISGKKEYGPAEIELKVKTSDSSILKGLDKKFTVWMSHGDEVISVPEGFKTLGSTSNVPFAFVENLSKKIFGVQFHPEVEHTDFGNEILKNFIEFCELEQSTHVIDVESLIKKMKLPTSRKSSPPSEASILPKQKMHNHLKSYDIGLLQRRIKDQVGNKYVMGAVSGGVDSTVAAFLCARAIGEKFIPVYVDNGLMRFDTKEHLEKIFSKLKIKPIIKEVKGEMLKRLSEIDDPEEKRKIIGNYYIELFEEEMENQIKKGKNIKFLLQGTIYSDVIESQGSKHASKIKSHHNVGGLPKDMKLKLIEPLREYYKDEVKEIGRSLDLPVEFVERQPFPGPGYAIRIRGEVTEERLGKEIQADRIVIEELEKEGILKNVFISFPVMTGAYSTAVKGDGKFFGEIVALRVVESRDIMTSKWARLPYDVLQKISSRIVNEVPGISRVVYDISTKPPATMEWE